RRPEPSDSVLFDLIDSGSVACDLSLALPPEALDDSLLPLFARHADFRLLQTAGGMLGPEVSQGVGTPEPTEIAAISGSGAEVRVGLAARLERSAAQGLILALQGSDSGLTLGCNVTYRTAESRSTVHLYGRWSAIYSYLYPLLDVGSTISRSSLDAHLID